MSPRTLVMLIESWWLAGLTLHHLRVVFILIAMATYVLAIPPYPAVPLGSLSLAILCHVGRGLLFRFISETYRRDRERNG